MTKEKILEERFGNYAKMFGGSVTMDMFYVMDEYAKTEIIAYEEWRRSVGAREMMEDTIINTPQELFERFKTNV